MVRTRLTDLFGIRLPVLGGGMMWLSDAHYVAALARAGALGFITPRSYENLDAVRDALRACRDASEGHPFGLNITQSRRSEENRLIPAWIDLALEEGVRSFETIGPASKALFARMQGDGGRVIHKCAFMAHALKAQDEGADAVALVGGEAGGHPGVNELPSFVLGALALESGRLHIPLAIGGGIGSGRQIAAALAMGADAVVMGTRLLVCEEIWAHEDYKRHLVAQPAEASTLALTRTSNPWRVLNNATVQQTRELEAQGATSYPEFGALATGRLGRDNAYQHGDWNTGLLSMGPAIGFAHHIEPVQALLLRLMAETSTRLADLNARHASLSNPSLS